MATVQYSDPANQIVNHAIDVHGFNPFLRTTYPLFRLGTVAKGKQATKWVYVKASEAVTSTCTVNTTTFALTDLAGNYTATDAFAAGEYGWVKQTAVDLA